MKTAYLDIETSYTGRLSYPQLCDDHKNHKITVIGVRILDGGNDSFVQLVGKEAYKEKLINALGGVDRIVTYNGRSIPDTVKHHTGFDFPVIAAQLGVVLDREFRHVDLCPQCWKAGLWGGQKAVEQTLGLKRTLPGRDGAWADKAWKQWEASKDERYLKELLAYNKEDVFMLRGIEEALKKR
ncbi:MAG TPA: ribonuclease H-like domain-containing protein [Candidatus Acidoferrales bacterium]